MGAKIHGFARFGGGGRMGGPLLVDGPESGGGAFLAAALHTPLGRPLPGGFWGPERGFVGGRGHENDEL